MKILHKAQLNNLTEILMDLESSINDFEMPANNQGITKPGRSVEFIAANVYQGLWCVNCKNIILDSQQLIFCLYPSYSFIYELFQSAHVNYETKTAVVEAMEQITGYLAGSEYL